MSLGSNWWTSGLSPAAGVGEYHFASDLELLAELMGNDAVFSVAQINAWAISKLPLRVYTTERETARKWNSAKLREEDRVSLLNRVNGDDQCAFPGSFDWALRYGDVWELSGHPWGQTIQDQGAGAGGPSLWYWTCLNMDVFGAAFWYMGHTAPVAMPIRKLQPFQSLVKVDELGQPVKFAFMPFYPTNMKTLEVPPEKLVLFRVPGAVLADVERHPGLRSGYQAAHAVWAYTRWQGSLFENRARPDIAFSPKEEMTVEEVDRIQSRWNQRSHGSKQGGVLVLEKEGVITPLSYDLADLSAMQVSIEALRRVANLMNVPEALLSKDATYANMQAAKRLHATGAIAPRVTLMEHAMYTFSSNIFGPDVYAIFNNPIPVDAITQIRRTTALVGAGSITINEVRERYGYAALPGALGNGLASATKPGPASANPTEQHGAPDRTPMANRDPGENAGRQRSMGKSVDHHKLNRLSAGGTKLALSAAFGMWLKSLRGMLWNDSSHWDKDTLTGAAMSLLASLAADEAQWTAKQMSLHGVNAPQMTFKGATGLAQEQINKWGPLMRDTTRRQIENLAKSESIPLPEAEEKYFADMGGRADRIAEDQAFRAQAAGQLWAIKSANKTPIWITAGDEKVCPDCSALDGTMPSGSGFMMRGSYISGPAESHTDCRCDLAYE